jgi:hypothetical protein
VSTLSWNKIYYPLFTTKIEHKTKKTKMTKFVGEIKNEKKETLKCA